MSLKTSVNLNIINQLNDINNTFVYKDNTFDFDFDCFDFIIQFNSCT